MGIQSRHLVPGSDYTPLPAAKRIDVGIVGVMSNVPLPSEYVHTVFADHRCVTAKLARVTLSVRGEQLPMKSALLVGEV